MLTEDQMQKMAKEKYPEPNRGNYEFEVDWNIVAHKTCLIRTAYLQGLKDMQSLLSTPSESGSMRWVKVNTKDDLPGGSMYNTYITAWGSGDGCHVEYLSCFEIGRLLHEQAVGIKYIYEKQREE